MWRDIRGALRSLARRPGFALAVLLTLAFGIGANSAVFTVVNAVLIRELPFGDSDRLVSLEVDRVLEGNVERWMHSYPNFVDLRDSVDELEDVIVYSQKQSLNMSVGGENNHVWVELVSAGYFEFLGIRLFLGRPFTAEEDQPPDGRRVAVISHSMWKRYYEGQRSLSERPIRLVDDVFEVVGVAPPGFRGLSDEADIWVPVTTARPVLGQEHYVESRGSFWLLSAARLREGIHLARAQASVDAAMAHIEEDFKEYTEGLELRLVPLREAWFGDLRFALWSLMGGAGFVLLIACTNVSNLLLARTLERQRELAIRTSLGAGRARLIRQILTESVALALAGGAAGALFAHWTTRFLISSSSIDLPEFIRTGADLRVIGFLTLLSVACGMAFGLIPAFTSSRVNLVGALKEGAQTPASSSRGLLQSSLIVGEVTLAFVLLAGAFHILRNFEAVRNTDLGFRSNDLVTMRLDLSGQSFYSGGSKIRVAQTLLEGLRSAPEVAEVAVAGPNLPIDEVVGFPFTIENNPDEMLMQYHRVSRDYFDLLGIPLVEGRTFLETDTARSLPVVIVGEDVARRFWPNEKAVGKRLKPGKPEGTAFAWHTVIGVVGDTNQAGFREDVDDYSDLYFNIRQSLPLSSFRLNVLMRTERPPDGDLLARLRAEVQALVPSQPAYDVQTLEQRLSEQIRNKRFQVLLMSLFTGLALILAAVGIYGLLAYLVTQKKRDFGIRLALGSRRTDLFRRIVGRAAFLAAIGIAVGAVTTVALRMILASRLEVVGTDPLILAGISVLLLALALGSSFVPAWRATRIDPNTVLREE